MPEEVVLRCDAPGCDEIGEYCTVVVDGKSTDVILGPKHNELLKEVAAWGRPSRNRAAAGRGGKRRSTDERRLIELYSPDGQ